MTSSSHIVAFCGLAGSGKNTAADHLLHLESEHVMSLAFADALKDAVSAIFQWDRHLLNGDTDASRVWREQTDFRWSSRLGRSITPRRVLQEIGTDVFRQHFHPDIWLCALEARLRDNTLHVITDARFENEMRWVTEQHGIILWVYRPSPTLDTIFPHAQCAHAPRLQPWMFHELQNDPAIHSSEVSFLTEAAHRIHVVLMNTGSRESLKHITHHARVVAGNPAHWDLPWGDTTLYLSASTDPRWAFEWRYCDTGKCRTLYCDARHQKVGDATSFLVYNTPNEVTTHV